MRAYCRVCRHDTALTRRGNVWWHQPRLPAPAPGSVRRCPGAGHPPLGAPGPDLDPLPGQLRDGDPLAREHHDGTVYLLCLDAPFGHARHYLGYAGPGNLAARLLHHLAGSGANLLRHVSKAGIGWALVRTWPGDRTEERRLKNRGGRTRLCPRCRPSLGDALTARLTTSTNRR